MSSKSYPIVRHLSKSHVFQGFNFISYPLYIAYKAEDDDELFSIAPRVQLKASTNKQSAENATAISDNVEGSSDNLSISLRRSIYDNEDDNDSEMTSLDGVSDPENNDNSINSLQNASGNNFARTFFNNTRRRMSSGLVLSYKFLKGASGKRRDST